MNIYDLLSSLIEDQYSNLHSDIFDKSSIKKLDDEFDKKAFILLKNISSLGMKVNYDSVEFHPFMVWQNNRTYSLEDISEDDYTLLLKLDCLRLPFNLKARIEDILWTQKKNYLKGIDAINSYLTLFEKINSKDDHLSIDYIRRACCIIKQINNTDLFDKACTLLFRRIKELDIKNNNFVILRLIECALNYNCGNTDLLICRTDEIIENNKGDLFLLEKSYGVKEECYKKKNDDANAKKAKLDLAEFYCKYVEEQVDQDLGPMRADLYLKKAIKLLRNNGNTQRAEEIHHRLIEIQKDIPKNMAYFRRTVDVSSNVEYIKKAFDSLSFEESIIRITQFLIFPDKEEEKNILINKYQNDPIGHLFSKSLINSNGQTIISISPLDIDNIEADQELLNQHIYQSMLDTQKSIGDFWLRFMLDYIRDNYSFDIDDLNFLFYNNAIIPEGRENIIKKGIYLALIGEYYEAIHILAPQTENIFRNIAKEAGGISSTLKDDGTSDEKVLKSIFDIPELIDCYDNDILFLFRGLLNEKSSANIRNEVAHGIITEFACGRGACLYFIVSLLKIIVISSLKVQEIYKKSELLHQLPKFEKE